MSTVRTTLSIGVDNFRASQNEVEIEVDYSVDPGRAATRLTPPEDASVTVEAIHVLADGVRIAADWLVTLLADDDDLAVVCLEHWHEDRLAAQDDAADARREERMLSRWGDA